MSVIQVSGLDLCIGVYYILVHILWRFSLSRKQRLLRLEWDISRQCSLMQIYVTIHILQSLPVLVGVTKGSYCLRTEYFLYFPTFYKLWKPQPKLVVIYSSFILSSLLVFLALKYDLCPLLLHHNVVRQKLSLMTKKNSPTVCSLHCNTAGVQQIFSLSLRWSSCKLIFVCSFAY